MEEKQLTYLSLFAGGGGGDIAMSLFLGMRCLGYVEWNPNCAKLLQQRIEDGHFCRAPIFNCDIREWVKQGYANAYKGMVDVVTGGFPCQPFSAAGVRQAEGDERNMWPATRETIRLVQPRFAFLENVSNLITFPYIREIVHDLAKIVYDARWCVLSAKDVGGFHLRKRLWILAASSDGIKSGRITIK